MRCPRMDKRRLTMDSASSARVAKLGTRVVPPSRDETHCHHHAKRDGRAEAIEPGSSSTVQLCFITSVGESHGQPNHATGALREKFCTLENDAISISTTEPLTLWIHQRCSHCRKRSRWSFRNTLGIPNTRASRPMAILARLTAMGC